MKKIFLVIALVITANLLSSSKPERVFSRHQETKCFGSQEVMREKKWARIDALPQTVLIDSWGEYTRQDCAECGVEYCYEIVWYD